MKTHNIEIIRRYQHEKWYLTLALVFICAGLLLYVTRPKIISPCPDYGCSIPVVYERVYQSDLEQAMSYIIKKFQPEGMVVVLQALDIAKCESHLNINAYNYNTNGTGDYGLFQINSIHTERYGVKFMHDWKANIDVAFDLYKSQGWSPWTCWRLL
jgi:hypothetical protein